MASLQTKIGIWNAALDILREQQLSSLVDVTPSAKWLSRNYDQQRDYLLERLNWKFALTRGLLTAAGEAPAFGWDFQYLVPVDCLKLIPLTIDGKWMGTPIPYEFENGYILTDQSSPLPIRYIRRITIEGSFSNGFAELLALRLAGKMAHFMTGKQSMLQLVDQMYKDTFKECRATEAFQVSSGVYYDNDLAVNRETIF